jgi:hypothetical protein
MMPPAAGQRAYTSPAAMGFPPSAYNAQAHAQAHYHNQLLAMQQMTQMSSINQQHQFGRPVSSPHPPSRHPTQTASGMPYASMAYPTSPYMYGPSQGMPAGVSVAARPQVDFNPTRQHSLQDHMNILQQSEQSKLQNQLESQLRQQLLAPQDTLLNHS